MIRSMEAASNQQTYIMIPCKRQVSLSPISCQVSK